MSPFDFISPTGEVSLKSNEIMLRNGASFENLTGIIVDTTDEKRQLKDAFSNYGVDEINGEKLDDFIIVSEKTKLPKREKKR